jgi:hypothetical protein
LAGANTFEREWFLGANHRDLTATYYWELRSLARTYSSEVSISRCRDCGIRFLTPIRNEGRKDMRCPCGCRKQHEAKSSSKRSAAYRKTEAGRKKKKELNRRRHLKSAPAKRQKNDDSVTQEKLPELLRYYRWLILLLDGVLMDVRRLKEFIEGIREKVRQRGRAQYDDSHYIHDD